MYSPAEHFLAVVEEVDALHFAVAVLAVFGDLDFVSRKEFDVTL